MKILLIVVGLFVVFAIVSGVLLVTITPADYQSIPSIKTLAAHRNRSLFHQRHEKSRPPNSTRLTGYRALLTPSASYFIQ